MKSILAILTFVLISTTSFAQEVRNGGGEDGVFKGIRDEIQTWIRKNLALGKLEEKLELKVLTGAELKAKYDNAMIAVGDQIEFNDHEIKIGGSFRICENNPVVNKITCNISAWNATRGDTRYMIVLHEYLGIALLEANINDYSHYPISPKILPFVKTREAYELGMEKTEYVISPTVAPQYYCQSAAAQLLQTFDNHLKDVKVKTLKVSSFFQMRQTFNFC